MTTTLLATKLNFPPARKNLVSRPRLLRILNESLQQETRLTLVSASAGYGKTTLVTEWLLDLENRATWISLDNSDNDPALPF